MYAESPRVNHLCDKNRGQRLHPRCIVAIVMLTQCIWCGRSIISRASLEKNHQLFKVSPKFQINTEKYISIESYSEVMKMQVNHFYGKIQGLK